MLGRFFLIALLLIGGAAVALWSTRTGYNVARSAEGNAITCIYWIGFGVAETRHTLPQRGDAFECPLLLRDVAP